MKAAVFALAAGTASAGIYGYESESSSTPVKSSSAAWEDSKEYSWTASSSTPASSSSAAWGYSEGSWSSSPTESVASSSSAAWGYPPHKPKGPWSSSSTETTSTTSAGWGKGSWKSSASASGGSWPTPAYFDPSKAYACCKTVVTVTVTPWATSPSSVVTSTSVVWVVPSPASSSETETWVTPVTSSSTSEAWVIPSSATWVASSSAAAWDPTAGEWTSSETWAAETTSSKTPTWTAETSTEATWTAETSTEATWTAETTTEATWTAETTTEATWTAETTTTTGGSWGAASTETAGSSTGDYGFVTKGGKWAMTYTPYTTSGECKTADEVNTDIADIASLGFTTVRIYATDCSALANVGSACKANGLKIILGVYIDTTGISGASSQVEEITAWGNSGYWDMIALIVVGNEAIFNDYCTASDLAGFIGTVKETWSAAGYTGPVTTTEPVDIIQQYASTLCSVVDVATSNVQPFFTASVSASWAGTFVNTELALVSAACGGKTAYALEAGWPSSGDSNGAAVASPDAQKAAIADILAKAGDKVAIFSYQNDAWKAPGTFGVEQYFGCASII